MRRFFQIAVFSAGLACAQIQQPAARRPHANVNATVSLNLSGLGLLCGNGRNAGSICNQYVPGTEQYLLIVGNPSAEARMFNYTVTVVLQGSATPRIFSGSIARAQEAPQPVSVFLQFGGMIDSYTIHIDELVEVGAIDAAGSAAN